MKFFVKEIKTNYKKTFKSTKVMKLITIECKLTFEIS